MFGKPAPVNAPDTADAIQKRFRLIGMAIGGLIGLYEMWLDSQIVKYIKLGGDVQNLELPTFPRPEFRTLEAIKPSATSHKDSHSSTNEPKKEANKDG